MRTSLVQRYISRIAGGSSSGDIPDLRDTRAHNPDDRTVQITGHNMKPPLILLTILAVFSGCVRDNLVTSFTDEYERWKLMNIHDYTIDQTRSCFCVDGGRPMRLTVRDDTLNMVVRISDGTLLSPDASRWYRTIDSLFGHIRNRGGDSLIVRYNPHYGYPEHLDINPQWHPVDGGVLYTTSNLRIP